MPSSRRRPGANSPDNTDSAIASASRSACVAASKSACLKLWRPICFEAQSLSGSSVKNQHAKLYYEHTLFTICIHNNAPACNCNEVLRMGEILEIAAEPY